ncbi:MAG: type III pantothenate kinase [Dehalococcoidia bacterium]
MLLTIDIGNTSVHFGVFDGEQLLSTWRLRTDINRLPDEYAMLIIGLLNAAGFQPADIHDCSLSSTVPSLTQSFQELTARYFHVQTLTMGPGVKSGIRILYDPPRDVGADRIIDALAAIRLYGPPLIVVDYGTGTVFDALSGDGGYLGGAVAPGIGLSAEALFARASRLYRVDLEHPTTAIGKNTIHALQSGILLGYVGLVEGLVARFQQELGGGARVIGTGGYAESIARATTVFDIVNPELTLIGLRLVHELNRGTGEAKARSTR